jgi:hypothetical protein
MRHIILEGLAILYLADTAPPVPSDAVAPVTKQSTVPLMEEWKKWSSHYNVAFTPSPADHAIARRLMKREMLGALMKQFWFEHSQPLIDGSFTGAPFILFAKFVKEQQ